MFTVSVVDGIPFGLALNAADGTLAETVYDPSVVPMRSSTPTVSITAFGERSMLVPTVIEQLPAVGPDTGQLAELLIVALLTWQPCNPTRLGSVIRASFRIRVFKMASSQGISYS